MSRRLLAASGVSHLWRSRSTTLVDQVLSSLSNLLAVILVARVLDPDEFGRFAIGYAMLTVTLTLSRSYFGNRISLSAGDEEARETTVAVVAAIILISPLIVGVVLLASVIASDTASLGILLLVAAATPVVCIQDALRFGAVATGRPRVALVSDGLWVLVMAAPLVLALDLPAAVALGVWGLAALAALLVALVAFGGRPAFGSGVRELRKRDAVGTNLAIGSLSTAAATLVVLAVVAHAIGSAGAGSLRGASSAMGPVNVLIAFTALSLTQVLVRRRRELDIRFCAWVAGVMVLLTLCWGAVLLLLPDVGGSALFGESWSGIRRVLPWTLAEYVGIVIGTAAVLGLKVRRHSRAIIVQRSTAALVAVTGGCVAGVAFAETWTVAAALAVAALAAATMGWIQLTRSRLPDAGAQSDHAGPDPDRSLTAMPAGES